MSTKIGQQGSRQAPLAWLAAAVLLLLASCVVDEPTFTEVANSQGGPTAVAPAPTISALPDPTVPPVPTPPLPPTATPIPPPTALPAPTPAVTPIPAVIPADDVMPTTVEAGMVTVPVGGSTSFALSTARPILQLPGHTLVYIDDGRTGEVDIFTPVATGAGTELAGFAAIADHLGADPAFADVAERDAVTIGGFATRVFEGRPVMGERGFYTDLATIGNDNAGWFPPLRVRIWLIDSPNGPVVVSAEALEDPGQYPQAVRLATEILGTITFS